MGPLTMAECQDLVAMRARLKESAEQLVEEGFLRDPVAPVIHLFTGSIVHHHVVYNREVDWTSGEALLGSLGEHYVLRIFFIGTFMIIWYNFFVVVEGGDCSFVPTPVDVDFHTCCDLVTVVGKLAAFATPGNALTCASLSDAWRILSKV
jgi:hypothetical protein